MINVSQPTSKQIARSRRLKRKLIIAIVLLVIVIGTLAVGAVYLYKTRVADVTTQNQIASTASSLADTTITDGESGSSSAIPEKITTIPTLSSLLGLTVDQAVANLGTSVAMTSSAAATDESNAAIVSLAKVTIATTGDDVTSGPTLYLYCNDQGSIIEVYYSVDLSQLGIKFEDYAAAVDDTVTLVSYLKDAGLEADATVLRVPDDSSITMKYTKSSDQKKLVGEEYTYSGDISGAALNHWELTLSYDYTLSNVTGTVDDTARTLTILFK
jgi:hypothetical protein